MGLLSLLPSRLSCLLLTCRPNVDDDGVAEQSTITVLNVESNVNLPCLPKHMWKMPCWCLSSSWTDRILLTWNYLCYSAQSTNVGTEIVRQHQGRNFCTSILKRLRNGSPYRSACIWPLLPHGLKKQRYTHSKWSTRKPSPALSDCQPSQCGFWCAPSNIIINEHHSLELVMCFSQFDVEGHFSHSGRKGLPSQAPLASQNYIGSFYSEPALTQPVMTC